MLAYSSIFVHVDASPRALIRAKLAVRIATAQRCRLVGVCATFATDPQSFYRVDHAAAVLEQDRARRERQHKTLQQRFESAVWSESASAEWRSVDGDPVRRTLREVKEAGLLVAGQIDASEPESVVAPQFLESLILESGRPVLVVPYAGPALTVGRRVLVAWDGGKECARALHDALPLLLGSTVHLLHANPVHHAPRADAAPLDIACRVLRDVGADVRTEFEPGANDGAIGDLILSRAADVQADLLVMGAYGHGRFRELVLGGVTKTILSSMTIPVLLAH